MIRVPIAILIGGAFLAAIVSSSRVSARELSFDDRVAAQRAIEQVYWNHRIWPKENPRPKPSLSDVLTESTIRARVEDYLEKSSALGSWWGRPITHVQLQAELDRMARDSRDPQVLGELFGALGNDPFLIAETLVRASLADRIVRDWHAGDTRSKQPFDEWWRAQAGHQSLVVEVDDAPFELPTLAAGCTNDTWKSTLQGSTERRRYHTAVWTGTEMIVWGGESYGGDAVLLDTGARYNPATGSWRPTSMANAPLARRHHTAVWTGTEMIVWGGEQTSPLSVLSEGRRYDPIADTWTDTGGIQLEGRAQHTAIWTGTRMIVWGGYKRDGGTLFYLDTGGQYDPTADPVLAWTSTSNTGAPVPRAGHTAVWTGTEMIVWGGTAGTGVYLGSGGRYAPATNTWTATRPGPTARHRHTAIWTGSSMIVWGGQNAGIENSGSRYSPTTDTWSPTPTGAGVPAPRSSHAAVWTGTEMVVWGGNSGADTNTGGRYNPIAGTWAATSVGANVPAPRLGFTTVWTGSEMLVWGGYTTTSGYVNTGSRYAPSSDSWVPIPTSASPEGRTEHTAIWTGTEMIVWGGITMYDTVMNTGGRYNPSLDTWTATSVGANVPTPRASHTAVWTGTEMIVWGGVGVPNWPEAGGRYDPLTDSWTVMAVGPAGRYDHTAVWTGTQMVVWGGLLSSATPTSTGSRYDPSSDGWTQTSTALAPAARFGQTAVWTGTQMIVWGGEVCRVNGCTTSTGGRYDPSSDAWTPMSEPGAPTPRTHHTAVWTGAEMIVWGGLRTNVTGPPTVWSTGGRYNPALGTWTATSVAGDVPHANAGHTGVWTGTEMIVWGASDTFDAGGRYTPDTNTWATIALPGPGPRTGHTAIWTPSEMIIWSGALYSPSGGRYCACPNGRTVYRDADGDGHGDPNLAASSLCDGSVPAGYSLDGSDCDDASPSIFAEAPEINDGLDNQCDGDAGYGLIDELSGTIGFLDPSNAARLSWSPQAGATVYDVVRSSTPQFDAGCLSFATNDAYVVDASVPVSGGRFYYLVRAAAPHVGSWGERSDGSPRAVGCLP